jgi:uncharacterized protein
MDHDARTANDETAEVTYLLIDGENIDATLGVSLLGHRPAPDERPRWEKVLHFVRDTWHKPVKGLFFINASSGNLPMPFVQALTAIGFRVLPLSGTSDEKVVDLGILRTLDALIERPGNVMVASHDGDFTAAVTELLGGERRVGILGFRECVSASLAALADQGLETFDLEDDARCFNKALPRLRIIPIDDFDPALYL